MKLVLLAVTFGYFRGKGVYIFGGNTFRTVYCHCRRDRQKTPDGQATREAKNQSIKNY